MGEAYRTWIILLYQSTVCMRGPTCFLIHQDVKAKASNLWSLALARKRVIETVKWISSFRKKISASDYS